MPNFSVKTVVKRQAVYGVPVPTVWGELGSVFTAINNDFMDDPRLDEPDFVIVEASPHEIRFIIDATEEVKIPVEAVVDEPADD